MRATDIWRDGTEDNINYYKCDVSKWEEVQAVSKQIIEEVRIEIDI